MSSITRRKRSPYWYISFKQEGSWKIKSTKFQVSSPAHTAKARAEAAQYAVTEATPAFRHSDSWVETAIKGMPVAELTKTRYTEAWGMLKAYMLTAKISLESFNCEHATRYVGWRTGRQDISFWKKNSRKMPCRNTALQELKILKIIQKHGRLLGRMHSRPMDDFVARLSPRKIKPAMTDAEIQTIREKLALGKQAEWMAAAFETALATGCRLAETPVPADCIDLANNTMTFPHPKGGAGKSFTIPIPEALQALCKKQKELGQPLCVLPKNDSKPWRVFFDRLGFNHLCFHCLRVSRVTRLRQSGVSSRIAQRLVNHSSALVHQLYDRHDVSELRDVVNLGVARATPLVKV